MCWPLSVAAVPASSDRARPPGIGADSTRVTSWPAWRDRTAAASPAQPAPTMAILIGAPVAAAERCEKGHSTAEGRPARSARRRSVAAPLRLAGDPELAQRGQRYPLVQHLEAAGLDLAQQAAIDVADHQRRLLARAVGLGQQREGLVVEAVGALGLEFHQGRETVAVAPGRLPAQDLVRLDVELLHLGDRQGGAAAPAGGAGRPGGVCLLRPPPRAGGG